MNFFAERALSSDSRSWAFYRLTVTVQDGTT